MILLCVLITLTPFCYCQNAEIGFPKTCYIAGEALTIEAVYTGTGTPQLVTWTYSGSSQVVVETTGCSLISSVPAGFPDASRLSFKCVTTDASLLANTYKLIVTGLQTDELDKTWAVTFTPPVGAAPAAVQSPVPSDCSKCTCDCTCKKKCTRIVIPSIIFGSFGAIILPVVIGGTVTEHFGQKTALVVDFIGIVCDVISLGLGIGVQVEDCCEGAEDCCEDSDCCEVECEKNWIETTAIVFIIIGCLVVIVAVVIFYLVWAGRIGGGNNGCNAFNCFNGCNCFNGGNNGGNDGGNNGGRGHGGGHGPNSNTVHSERTDTHRVPTSDRANSDSEVSRKDVHVQENRHNFSGRPLPQIQQTDKTYVDDSGGAKGKKANLLRPIQ